MKLTIKELPFPEKVGLDNAISYTLPLDLYVDKYIIPEGTTIKLVTTENFGFIVLKYQTPDIDGRPIPRQLFRY